MLIEAGAKKIAPKIDCPQEENQEVPEFKIMEMEEDKFESTGQMEKPKKIMILGMTIVALLEIHMFMTGIGQRQSQDNEDVL